LELSDQGLRSCLDKIIDKEIIRQFLFDSIQATGHPGFSSSEAMKDFLYENLLLLSEDITTTDGCLILDKLLEKMEGTLHSITNITILIDTLLELMKSDRDQNAVNLSLEQVEKDQDLKAAPRIFRTRPF
jgi:hypothetical protein